MNGRNQTITIVSSKLASVKRSGVNGRINIASIAASGCRRAETAESNIVLIPAERLLTEQGSKRRKGKRSYKKQKLTLPNGSRQTPLFTGNCEQCGDEMAVKRATGPKRKKYCSTRCRVAAFRARQMESESDES